MMWDLNLGLPDHTACACNQCSKGHTVMHGGGGGGGGRKTPRARWPGCRAGDSSETVPNVAGFSRFSREPERPDSEATAPTF